MKCWLCFKKNMLLPPQLSWVLPLTFTRLVPIFLYVCPVPIPYFHPPFYPHHISLLALSLDHLLGCLFQPIPLCWIPWPWLFPSRQLMHSLLLRLSWCSRSKAFQGTAHSDPAALREICWTDLHGEQWLSPTLRLAEPFSVQNNNNF